MSNTDAILKMSKKVTKTVESVEDFYMCPYCKKEYKAQAEAEKCKLKDEEQYKRKIAQQEANRKKEEKLVNRALDAMPKIPEDEYTREALNLALSFVADIIPCLGCGHPHVDGYLCDTPDCNGGPEYLDNLKYIDTDEIFEDFEFQLPYGDWKIVCEDEEKKYYWPICPFCGKPLIWDQWKEVWFCINDMILKGEIKDSVALTKDEWLTATFSKYWENVELMKDKEKVIWNGKTV